MRVMMLSDYFLPNVGGVEVLLEQVASILTTRGHEVLVVTADATVDAHAPRTDLTTVVRLPAHRAVAADDAQELFRLRREVIRLTSELRPDVVHAHNAGIALWLYARSVRPPRPPLVVSMHNVRSGFEDVLGSVCGMLAPADWITGVSQDVVDDLARLVPEAADRMSVIVNGASLPLVALAAVPVDPPRISCIGRLVEQKGFDRAIDAFAIVAARHPTVRLTIAGRGPQDAALRRRARARGVDDRVDFVGMLDRVAVAALLQRSTAVLVPSRFEGLPLVALEAAVAGRPVVATRAAGLRHAVVDGETALVVEPDIGAIAGALERLVTEPKLARRLGNRARAVAEREFSLERCVDAYEALYARLQRGARGAEE